MCQPVGPCLADRGTGTYLGTSGGIFGHVGNTRLAWSQASAALNDLDGDPCIIIPRRRVTQQTHPDPDGAMIATRCAKTYMPPPIWLILTP